MPKQYFSLVNVQTAGMDCFADFPASKGQSTSDGRRGISQRVYTKSLAIDIFWYKFRWLLWNNIQFTSEFASILI